MEGNYVSNMMYGCHEASEKLGIHSAKRGEITEPKFSYL